MKRPTWATVVGILGIIFDFFTKMWNFPEWYGTWSIISGILKLLVSAFYLFASIRLLQTRLSAIKLFCGAAGPSIALGALKAAVAPMIGSFMSIAIMSGGLFGIHIDKNTLFGQLREKGSAG